MARETYSDLPNNHAANLIIFLKQNHLHNLRVYQFLIFFYQNLIFTLVHKWEKNTSYTALLRPTRLLISEKSAIYTIKWSYTIIWQIRAPNILFGQFSKIGQLFGIFWKKSSHHISKVNAWCNGSFSKSSDFTYDKKLFVIKRWKWVSHFSTHSLISLRKELHNKAKMFWDWTWIILNPPQIDSQN